MNAQTETVSTNTKMQVCMECPRKCGVSRVDNQLGFCRATRQVTLARAALHMWEEPCISGQSGSGAVFFSGCNLQCVYCQNIHISNGSVGKTVSIDRLADIFLELQEKGANNINLVTPSHYVHEIVSALLLAKDKGLRIPVVYNSSAYELPETLAQLKGLVDIYLPDCKYYDDDLAVRLSHAPNYFKTAFLALRTMYAQVGEPVFDGDLMKRGMIIRHLVLPGHIKDSKKVLKALYEEFGNNVYYSIMNQYTPLQEMLSSLPSELCRQLTLREYDEVVDYAIDLGIENGFIQEGETAKESFIPAFDYEGV